MTEQTRSQLDSVLSDLAGLAEEVSGAQLDDPTPCAKFDVAALIDHIVGWLENFSAGYADPRGNCPMADVSEVHVEVNEAAPRIRRAADQLDSALAGGAAERDLVIPGQGGMPGGMALSMILGEYLLHGWDLAKATGQPWSPDEAAVTSSHEFLQGMVTPESRGPEGMFDVEVPVDATAPALDRLVGFAGRDPHWSAV